MAVSPLRRGLRAVADAAQQLDRFLLRLGIDAAAHRLGAGLVLQDGVRAPPGVRVDAHHGAVRLLAGGIEGQPTLGRGRDAVPVALRLAQRRQTGEDAGRNPREPGALASQPRVEAFRAGLRSRQQHARAQFGGGAQGIGRTLAGQALDRQPVHAFDRQSQSNRVLVRTDQVASRLFAEAAQFHQALT